MANGQTSNYGLNQWAAEDRVLREEFNQDNARLDAALTALTQPVFKAAILAEYDGTEDVKVELGAQPSMVLVGNCIGLTNIVTSSGSSSDPGHTVALPGYPGYFSGFSGVPVDSVALEVTETGFLLHAGMSTALNPYYYLALFEGTGEVGA